MIYRLAAEGLLEPARCAEALAHKYRAADLRAALAQFGLPVSGTKAQLAERLVQANPWRAESKVTDVTLLECSDKGRHVVEEYMARPGVSELCQRALEALELGKQDDSDTVPWVRFADALDMLIELSMLQQPAEPVQESAESAQRMGEVDRAIAYLMTVGREIRSVFKTVNKDCCGGKGKILVSRKRTSKEHFGFGLWALSVAMVWDIRHYKKSGASYGRRIIARLSGDGAISIEAGAEQRPGPVIDTVQMHDEWRSAFAETVRNLVNSGSISRCKL